jgi:hypothetical protein
LLDSFCPVHVLLEPDRPSLLMQRRSLSKLLVAIGRGWNYFWESLPIGRVKAGGELLAYWANFNRLEVSFPSYRNSRLDGVTRRSLLLGHS